MDEQTVSIQHEQQSPENRLDYGQTDKAYSMGKINRETESTVHNIAWTNRQPICSTESLQQTIFSMDKQTDATDSKDWA